jgi:hypothetical protein
MEKTVSPITENECNIIRNLHTSFSIVNELQKKVFSGLDDKYTPEKREELKEVRNLNVVLNQLLNGLKESKKIIKIRFKLNEIRFNKLIGIKTDDAEISYLNKLSESRQQNLNCLLECSKNIKNENTERYEQVINNYNKLIELLIGNGLEDFREKAIKEEIKK